MFLEYKWMMKANADVDSLVSLGIKLESSNLYQEAGECYHKAILQTEGSILGSHRDKIQTLLSLWDLRSKNFALRGRHIDADAAFMVKNILLHDLNQLLMTHSDHHPKEIFPENILPKKIDKAYRELDRRRNERQKEFILQRRIEQ